MSSQGAALIKIRQINREVADIPADGDCKFTRKTAENWRLNTRRKE